MNEEITASYVLTTDAMLPALRWHQRNLFRIVGGVMFGVIAVFMLGALFREGFQTQQVIMAAVALLLTLPAIWLWFFIMKRFLRMAQAQNIRSMPGYGQRMHWTATDDALKSSLENATSSIPWSQVFKSVETPDGILIYLQKMLFNWLPKTAFTTESDYTRFLGLVAAKTKHSKVG